MTQPSETNPPPQPTPPVEPTPQPTPPAQPPTPPQTPPQPQLDGSIGEILGRIGQTLQGLPEQLADAVKEQAPTPPPPPNPAGDPANPANPAGAVNKSFSEKLQGWWFGR